MTENSEDLYSGAQSFVLLAVEDGRIALDDYRFLKAAVREFKKIPGIETIENLPGWSLNHIQEHGWSTKFSLENAVSFLSFAEKQLKLLEPKRSELLKYYLDRDKGGLSSEFSGLDFQALKSAFLKAPFKFVNQDLEFIAEHSAFDHHGSVHAALRYEAPLVAREAYQRLKNLFDYVFEDQDQQVHFQINNFLGEKLARNRRALESDVRQWADSSYPLSPTRLTLQESAYMMAVGLLEKAIPFHKADAGDVRALAKARNLLEIANDGTAYLSDTPEIKDLLDQSYSGDGAQNLLSSVNAKLYEFFPNPEIEGYKKLFGQNGDNLNGTKAESHWDAVIDVPKQ